MESRLIKSSKFVACFLVALNARKEINVQLKSEVDLYGDIIMAPFMDCRKLVVLMTVAIHEYEVRTDEFLKLD